MFKKVLALLLLSLSLNLIGTNECLAQTQGEEIVIVAKNESLSSVLKKLEKNSTYKVMYSSKDVSGVKINKTVRSTNPKA